MKTIPIGCSLYPQKVLDAFLSIFRKKEEPVIVEEPITRDAVYSEAIAFVRANPKHHHFVFYERKSTLQRLRKDLAGYMITPLSLGTALHMSTSHGDNNSVVCTGRVIPHVAEILHNKLSGANRIFFVQNRK